MMLLLKIKQHKISSLSLISQQNLEKPEKLLTFLQCLNSFSGLMGLLKKILLKMQSNYLSILNKNTSNPVAIVAAIIELSLTRLLAGLYILCPPDSAVSPQSYWGCTGQGKVRGCLRLQAAYGSLVPPCRCHRHDLKQGRRSLRVICGSKPVPWEAAVCRWLRAGGTIAAIPYQFGVASFLK